LSSPRRGYRNRKPVLALQDLLPENLISLTSHGDGNFN